jgi:AcrR family transcriptional regulator
MPHDDDHDDGDEGAARPRGRQSEAARNDLRIVDAARRVFARSGVDAPVSAIAAEAGVGVGSLYRRFASKDDLLRHLCQAAMDQSVEAAEAALASLDAGGDAWPAVDGYVRACVDFRSGAFAPVAGTFPVTGEMIATADRAHRLLERLLDAARREGTLRDGVTAIDVYGLVGLFSRRVPAEAPGQVDPVDPTEQRLLAIALDGLRAAPGRSPLPGPRPRWADYSAEWGPAPAPAPASSESPTPPEAPVSSEAPAPGASSAPPP